MAARGGGALQLQCLTDSAMATAALCDPTVSVLPACSPMQVTEVRVASGDSAAAASSSSYARVLLSDKQLKLWCVLSAGSLARFQAAFTEFGPTLAQLQLLTGGIIPTRFDLRVHSNLQEFELHIDEFEVRSKTERTQARRSSAGSAAHSCSSPLSCGLLAQYKGGAGNNEFASPLFHTEGTAFARIQADCCFVLVHSPLLVLCVGSQMATSNSCSSSIAASTSLHSSTDRASTRLQLDPPPQQPLLLPPRLQLPLICR